MGSRRRLTQRTSTRLQLKLTWKHAAAGVALAGFIAVGVFLYLNLGTGGETKAAGPARTLVYSIANGSWSSGASWYPRVPQSGDSIIIKDGHKIDLKETITLKATYIGVYGTLWIDHGKKLQLYDNSKIEVFGPNGKIDGAEPGGSGGTSATRVEYNGTALWTSSMEPVTGYSYIDETGFHQIGTLPIELSYFKAKIEGRGAKIEWATVKEKNNDFFTIERSKNGKDFYAIGTVTGAGNSNTTKTYTYTDASPLAGTSYYRLMQTDYDGRFERFKVVRVSNDGQQVEGVSALTVRTVGPNPFSQGFNVDFELAAAGTVELRLMNMQGRVVASERVEGYEGSNRYEFSDSHGLEEGTYLLSLVQNNNTSKVVRVVKRR